MKKTILLTGSFGSVGYETLKQLTQKSNLYNIRIMDIKTKRNVKLYKKYKDIVKVYWEDLSIANDYKDMLTGIDFIIHLAAIIPPLADKNTILAKKINFLGTIHLVNQMKKYAKKAFLLYSSSISIYGDRVASPMIRVSDKLIPSEGDYYAQTKIMAEQFIKSANITYTIFRFSAIMSPKAKLNPLFFHMPLKTSIEIATTRDTAFALVQAIEKKAFLLNKTFNLSGGNKCRILYKDFLISAFKLSNLGSFNLPKSAFATKNFHCGFYADSNILNNILHFQRDTVNDYLTLYKNSISKLQLFFTSLFKKFIKNQLIKKSEPLLAIKHEDLLLQKHFFGCEI